METTNVPEVSEFIFPQCGNHSPLPSVAVRFEMKETRTSKAGRPDTGCLKRSHKVTVAFNDDEFLRMTDKAEMSGLSTAVYCRKSCLTTRILQPPTEDIRSIHRAMCNTENNLNQLVRCLHARRDYRYEEDLGRVIAGFDSALRYVKEVMSDGR